MRILTALTSQPWAILPEALGVMCAVALREQADRDAAALVREARSLRPSAVAAQLGRPMDGTRAVTVRDGVAMLPIAGPIFRYANLMTEISGGASVESLALDLRAALDSPQVGAILLVIDSPGGEVTGTATLAAQIRQASEQKPVWAYVEGLGASAAYWLAAATSRIVCECTAALGSVGVVMAVPDPTAQKVRDITFVSSQSPNKRPDPTTEAGRDRFQAMVDDTADVFIAAVAAYRGMTADAVVTDFEQGGLLTGQKAVAAGMADTVGTLEGCLADLSALARDRAMRPMSRRAAASEAIESPLSARLRSMYRETL